MVRRNENETKIKSRYVSITYLVIKTCMNDEFDRYFKSIYIYLQGITYGFSRVGYCMNLVPGKDLKNEG